LTEKLQEDRPLSDKATNVQLEMANVSIRLNVHNKLSVGHRLNDQPHVCLLVGVVG
jgi:hypothetical protein